MVEVILYYINAIGICFLHEYIFPLYQISIWLFPFPLSLNEIDTLHLWKRVCSQLLTFLESSILSHTIGSYLASLKPNASSDKILKFVHTIQDYAIFRSHI